MSSNLPLISVNGVLDAAISPLDRGFAYGDGIFETCRMHQGKVPLWDYHWERLEQSAKCLKIPLDKQRLIQYRDELINNVDSHAVTDAIVKITLTRGIGGRGYRLPECPEPTYCIGIFPGVGLQSPPFINGVSVRVCDLRLSCNPILAGMKHLNRLEHILARSEWLDEFAEGILLDEKGRVIEATVSNIFVVKNGQLYTSDLSMAGVAGIMRRFILEKIAPATGLVTHIIEMKLEFLAEADEIFLCNSVFGIWPINHIFFGFQALPELTDSYYRQYQITQKLQKNLLSLLEE
ncbi:aminodeoxychorismate lyase [Cellvibrio sp. pealriver]|uniref:aminodeoxychorismate lyase n=1 Tax=Cellvibrio sp. pealriver TaxID=1622269 RepID=UPI00066FB655|nr:aminodeoxychorismate lyase [Cellvibrio sp. pealriver]